MMGVRLTSFFSKKYAYASIGMYQLSCILHKLPNHHHHHHAPCFVLFRYSYLYGGLVYFKIISNNINFFCRMNCDCKLYGSSIDGNKIRCTLQSYKFVIHIAFHNWFSLSFIVFLFCISYLLVLLFVCFLQNHISYLVDRLLYLVLILSNI